MKYYKVKAAYDQRRRKDGSIFLKDELYTPGELDKYKIPAQYVDEIEASKKDIYFCFGGRFLM